MVQETYRKLHKKGSLRKSSKVLYSYSSHKIHPVGAANLVVRHNGAEAKATNVILADLAGRITQIDTLIKRCQCGVPDNGTAPTDRQTDRQTGEIPDDSGVCHDFEFVVELLKEWW